MRIVSNAGSDRVVDLIRPALASGRSIDIASAALSLFAFAELDRKLFRVASARLLLPAAHHDLGFFGSQADRAARNRLQIRWLADRCADWLEKRVTLRRADGAVPQGTLVLRDHDAVAQQAVVGAFAFNTEGLGMTPSGALNLIQATESAAESEPWATWFDQQWLQIGTGDSEAVIGLLRDIAAHRSPVDVYAAILESLFGRRGNELDEQAVIKAATGFPDTEIWQRLYKFQRDGVVAAIDKLDRFGGCIIADSVGLGKTFEALAVIKYCELRNDRVLVLCPKRLRDNWTLYKANDRRNILAHDQFGYDVLNHTDLTRDAGQSGDIDLRHVNWGNYDLVVIDESHNFRNKHAPRPGGETRYDRLMRKIVQEGVKTRVLMLSATPVNNRLADLRNQIAFATEGDDAALSGDGIKSINQVTHSAQRQFNRWLSLDETERTPTRLVEMLGFDYFTLLDHLTIARSRRHIEKYYGTSETGSFPTRLKPINLKPDVDLSGEFPPIQDVNGEIRRLHLAVHAPLRYVLPSKQEAYQRKYSTKLGQGKAVFLQTDREDSLIHLLRANVLKRMESSVAAFALTIERQLQDVEAMLARIDERDGDIEALDVAEVDLEDPAIESLTVGDRVKVLIQDVDLIRWRQDLEDDRDRLARLRTVAESVDVNRDAKLAELRAVIEGKCRAPINPGNRKVVVFTAFADTARYLYEQLAPWAQRELDMYAALVTGSGSNQTNLAGIGKNLASILSAFAPQARQRPRELASEGELDLLIATDCISEGQNLQDCDWLINYDIHWNPVRIIQRFGRIDRIGAPNERIQLVNFWPNLELEEYLQLEQRVSGRMVLLDVSATGEENVIERQSGDAMNDLAYRRKQLLELQDAVVDLEDMSSGISITDLTFTDFRIDLAEHRRLHAAARGRQYPGMYAVTRSLDDVEPGVVFCLQATGGDDAQFPTGYPFAPYHLIHVGDRGDVLLTFTQARKVLDRLRRLCAGVDNPDAEACVAFDKRTRNGRDMQDAQRLLGHAISAITGHNEQRAVESLFTPGGTHGLAHEFAGIDDFEVVAFLVVLPEATA